MKIIPTELVYQATSRWGQPENRWYVRGMLLIDIKDWMNLKEFQEFKFSDEFVKFVGDVGFINETFCRVDRTDGKKPLDFWLEKLEGYQGHTLLGNMLLRDEAYKVDRIFKLSGYHTIWEMNLVGLDYQWYRTIAIMGQTTFRVANWKDPMRLWLIQRWISWKNWYYDKFITDHNAQV